MKQGFFSSKVWVLRFVYAIHGFVAFFKSEHNAIVYSFATVSIILFSFILHISGMEAVSLVIVTGAVWCCELINTAIERLADIVSPQHNAQVKIVKDVAAAAVLVSAITALVTAGIIFIPKII